MQPQDVAWVQALIDLWKKYRDAPMQGNKVEIVTIRKTLNVVICEAEAALAAAPQQEQE